MTKFLLSVCIALTLFLPAIPENYAVLDTTGRSLISPSTINYIFESNNQLYYDTGGEIFFYFTNAVPTGNTIESYSLSVFNNWNLGRHDTANGILVTIATGNGLVWMTVGDGLRQHMPVAVISQYIENYFLEYSNNADYNMAVLSLFNALSDRLYLLFPPDIYQYAQTAYAPAQAQAETNGNNWSTTFWAILIVLGLFGLLYFISSRSRRKRRPLAPAIPMPARRRTAAPRKQAPNAPQIVPFKPRK